MASHLEGLTGRIAALREGRPVVDHVVGVFRHYETVNGNAWAGAVTFFGFLSFFPILALAFFVVGFVSKVYDLEREVADTIEQVLPGIIGNADGQIPLSTFEEYAGAAGLVGLLGVLYAGLGWLSGMRDALEVMFRLPRKEHPNFVLGKARDLKTLLLLGIVLLVSISLTGLLSGFSSLILGWVQLEGSWLAAGVLWLVATGLAIVATTVLFVTMFRLLAQPHVAARALTQGAVVGAVGFEVLKSVAGFLIGLTKDQPAFQAFGVALILLVWINYFSRLVMVSAAWAYTSPLSEELRAVEAEPIFGPADQELLEPAPAAVVREDPQDSPVPRERARRRRARRAAAARVTEVTAGVARAVGRRRRQ